MPAAHARTAVRQGGTRIAFDRRSRAADQGSQAAALLRLTDDLDEYLARSADGGRCRARTHRPRLRRTALVVPRALAGARGRGSRHSRAAAARTSRCSMRAAKRRPSRCLAPPLPASPMYRSTIGSPTPISPPCSGASRPRTSSATWSASSGWARTAAMCPGRALRSSAQRNKPADTDISPDESGEGIAIQLFTSGTTAAPKAARPAPRQSALLHPGHRRVRLGVGATRPRWSACRPITLPESRRC